LNVDKEFFAIVEQLGPIGDISLRSFVSHPATGSVMQEQSCGCRNTGESASTEWDDSSGG
jgi:hypothetical protein